MPLGVMQGRLLPKYQGRYQAFPLGYWEEEFFIARQLGLELIEFILDFNDASKNPLMSQEGIQQIQKVCQESGVNVHSICADYFMEAPLHSAHSEIRTTSQSTLQTLIQNAEILGCSNIVIPCVDQSSFLNDTKAETRFIDVLQENLKMAQTAGVYLALETDLPPQRFLTLLLQCDSPAIKVNYDIGNSAALGYVFQEELAAYGSWVSDVHIKDRVVNGGSVVLGSGDAKIEGVCEQLKKFKFQGPIIMQAYRDEEGVGIFKQQLDWVVPLLKKHLNINLTL